MKKLSKYALLILCIMVSWVQVNAYEVNTHQELTNQAISGDQKAENLKFFIRTFNLEDVDYSKEGNGRPLHWIVNSTTTLTATGSYHNIVDTLTNNQAVKLGIALSSDYLGTIEAGAILEDTAISTKGLDITHGRFNRHFYDIHEEGCYGLTFGSFGQATCSREWGYNGGGANDTNLFTWLRAKEYYFDSIAGGSPEDRKKAQANLFITIGHIAHLLQDLGQPSHTRNDAHPGDGKPGGPTAIEPWASENFKPGTDDIGISTVSVRHISGYHQAFINMATYTHNNFFSDDTIIGQFADGDHGSPSATDITEIAIPNRDNIFYMTSNRTDLPFQAKLAIHEVVDWWHDSYTLTDGFDQSVLEHNAKILFPRVISTVEGFVNYIFRGRILATVDSNDDDTLVIKNITDQAVLATDLRRTIMASSNIHVLYETASGLRLPLLRERKLPENLGMTEEYRITGFREELTRISDELLSDDERINDDKTIVVVIDGHMGGGQEEFWMVAGTQFNFLNNTSTLFSFDRSGSMGESIEIAKNSALSVLPILSAGESNEASVQSFSGYVSNDIDYTNDFEQVKVVINSINSTGYTALYDAIASAGSSAETQALDNSGNKSIVILYADGEENASTSSKQNAIDAISRIDHPEIDLVYLVFVGDDQDGANELSDIAAKAGRKFLKLNSIDQLTSELLNILN